jgi:hypothetical protein
MQRASGVPDGYWQAPFAQSPLPGLKKGPDTNGTCAAWKFKRLPPFGPGSVVFLGADRAWDDASCGAVPAGQDGCRRGA